MKFFAAIISFLLCFCVIMAQRNCPSACPQNFSPVCGEAEVNGQTVRCQFSNACEMGVSSCNRNIKWRQSSCFDTSPNCGSLA